MNHIPVWGVLIGVSIIAVIPTVLVGFVSTEWLSPLNIIPIKLLVMLLVFVAAWNCFFGLYSHFRLTRTQRMLSGIFGLLMTFFPAMCIAPYAYSSFQFESVKGQVIGELRNGTNPQEPLVKIGARGKLKTGGYDPGFYTVIILILMMVSLFSCVGLQLKTEGPKKRKPRKSTT